MHRIRAILVSLGLLVVASGLGLACGGDNGGDDKAEIESAVRGTVDALNSGDIDKYVSYFTQSCQDRIDKDVLKEALDQINAFFPGAKMKLEKLEVTKVEGDKATMTITSGFVDGDGNPIAELDGVTTEESEAVKEDGKWRNPDCADMPQKS